MSNSALPLESADVRGVRPTLTWRDWVPHGGPLVLVGFAVALWALSLRDVQLREMSDLGLASVLPPPFFVAVGLLTVSFCVSLRQAHRSHLILAVHLLALIVMLYGATPLIEEVPRFKVTWRHIGVVEYITRNGTVDPTIDAYFNWPGFFILSGFLTKAAGFASARSIVEWAPLFFNVLYLGPLLVILRTATKDARLVWLAAWLFFSTNWIGQDYFSPQGFSYFLYLVVLAVVLRAFVKLRSLEDETRAAVTSGKSAAAVPAYRLLRSFAGSRTAGATDQGAPRERHDLSPGQRTGLIAIVIVLLVALVPTHQLTPFVILGALTALVLARQSPLRVLPILLAVLIGTWVALMAVTFISGHGEQILSQVGQVRESVEANVQERVQGSAEHVTVIRLRVIATAAVWALGLLGALLAFRHGRRILPYGLLALTPFVFFGLQAYGGEVLLRIYFLSLPFVALLAALAFYPTRASGRRWVSTGALGLVCLSLLGAFVVTRYGNERMEYFTPQELEAVEHLYAAAPPGALLIAGSGNLPWRYQGYEQFDYVHLLNEPFWQATDPRGADVSAVVRGLNRLIKSRAPQPGFLIITRSQKVEIDATGIAVPGSLERLERALSASPAFEQIYANEDARIFVLAERPKEANAL